MTSAEKLIRLAKFLQDMSDTKDFDMKVWSSGATPGECGTAACAVGWATTIPEFRAMGFRIIHENPGSNFPRFEPAFKGKDGLEAAAVFFEIPIHQAAGLFLPSQYPSDVPITPLMVSDRIMASVTTSQLRKA